MDIKLINKFLSYFGNPVCGLLKDIEKAKGYDFSKLFRLETLQTINRETPFGLFFTPNGDYGNRNKTIGERIERTKETAADAINCIFLEVDLKDTDFSSLAELKDFLLPMLKTTNPIPNFFIQSGGGFHIYWLIQPEDRYRVYRDFENRFKDIQEAIAEKFIYGDKSSMSINKYMRLPGGYHWKTGIPKYVQLYGFQGGELVEFTNSYEPENYITYDEISAFVENISRVEIDRVEINAETKKKYQIINDISIVEIIDKLQGYPRIYEGKEYLYYYSPTYRTIYFTVDGVAYYPDGYRVNIRDNYVHNFTMSYHDINERPRGGVYAFLNYYFYKDKEKIYSFLKEEFNVILDGTSSQASETYLSLYAPKGMIQFTNSGVIYLKDTQDGQGNLKQVEVKLFDIPILVKGVLKTRYDNHGETDNANFIYMIENVTNGEVIEIQFTESRSRFNKTYGKMGIMFYGSEFDLLEFYQVINRAVENKTIKNYNLLYMNGWYKDYYVVGDKILNKDAELLDKEELNIVMKTSPITFEMSKPQVSIYEFYSMLNNLFSDRVSTLSLLAFISAMLGHKFWMQISKHISQFQFPALFLSGRSKTGKSSCLISLKNGFGYHVDDRRYTIASTSIQPIKFAATDDFLLHLEEFTGEIRQDKESIIRDIINKTTASTGRPDGMNIYYSYRSSLLLDGENLPESESVVNRCVVIPTFEEDKRGTQQLLNDITKVSFFKDFIKQAYSTNVEQLLDLYNQGQLILNANGIHGRDANIYTYLYIVNKIFLGLEDDDLVSIIKMNTGLLGEIDSSYNDLSKILSDLYTKYKIKPSINYLDSDTKNIVHIMIPEEYKARNKIIILGIIRKYKGYIGISGNTLNISISPKDTSDLNKELYNVVKRFEKYIEFKSSSILQG